MRKSKTLPSLSDDGIIAVAKTAFSQTITSLSATSGSLNKNFIILVRKSYSTISRGGKLLLTGIGKSGIAATKTVSTLASMNIPAFYVNAVDAYHGDLGLFTENDFVVFFSFSGNTPEVIRLASAVRNRHIYSALITGNQKSQIASLVDLVIPIICMREASGKTLVPMSSVTSTIALGDAFCVCLGKLSGFTRQAFKRNHPGGYLGKIL